MGIRGDLTTINLADIFQTLAMNEKTGILKVNCGQKSKKIFLKEGEILSISLSYREWPFGEFLLMQGLLNNQQYRELLDLKEENPDKSLETLVTETGLFSDNQLEDMMTLQVAEEIYDLFTWDGGGFDFEETDDFLELQKGMTTDTRIVVNTRGLILEAARRVDEWERFKGKITSSKDIFNTTRQEEISGIELSEDEEAVLACIKGERDVSEIAMTANIGIFEVYSSLFSFLNSNLIYRISIAEMLETGKKSMLDQNYSKAVKVFERINELEEDEPELVRRYAEALEKFGDIRLAAIQYMLLATLVLGERKIDEAISYFSKVLELIPEDTMARERLSSILENDNRKKEALEQYSVLADIYYASNALEDCRTTLRKILNIDESNITARKKLAGILVKLECEDEGLLEYEIVAEKLYSTMEPEKLKEALQIYEKIVAIGDGKSPELRMELANIYMLLDRNEEAVREFLNIANIYREMPDPDEGVNMTKWELLIDVYKQVLAIEPDNLEAKEKIAEALIEVGTSDEAKEQFKEIAAELREQGDIVRSTEFLQKVKKLEPTDLSSRFELAENLISKGKFDEAILEYRGIALAAKSMNDFQRAETAYQTIIELNPFEINAHKGLAEVYYKKGDVEKSIEKYKSVGLICYGAGLYGPALGAYQIINSFDPNDIGVIREISDIFLKLKDPDAAAESLWGLADMYLKEKDNEKALAVFKEIFAFKNDSEKYLEKALDIALELTSEKDIVLYGKMLANILENKGKIDAAIAVFSKIHDNVPGEIQVLNDYSVLLEKQGNTAKAGRFYRELSKYYLNNDLLPQSKNIILKAEKLLPDDTKIQLVLALLAAKSGDIKEAEKRFDKILSAENDNIIALKGLGDIYVRKEDIDQAIEKFDKALFVLKERQEYEEMIKIQETVLALREDDIDETIRMTEIYELLGDEMKLNVYVSQAAQLAVNKGDKEKGYEIFRKILDRNSGLDNVRRSYFNLALAEGDKKLAAQEGVKLARHCMERSDYRNALTITEYVLKIAPEDSAANIERDKIYFENGNIDKGLEGLKTTIMCLKDENNFFRLKQHLRAIQKYIPRNAGLHETIGAIYAKEGAFEEAMEEYTVALNFYKEAGNEKAAQTCSKVIGRLMNKIEGEEESRSTKEMLKELFDSYDKAKDKNSFIQKIWDATKENLFNDNNLLFIEENCKARDLEDLACEAQRNLIKIYSHRNLYNKTKEIFETTEPAFDKDTEIMGLVAEISERNGDNIFAKQCFMKLFKEYDTHGNTERAVGVCGRILQIEPYNKKAIHYIREFAQSKEHLTPPLEEDMKAGRAPVDDESHEQKNRSRELFETCQKKLNEKSSGDEKHKELQEMFISAMTEESLANYEESIRIYSEILEKI